MRILSLFATTFLPLDLRKIRFNFQFLRSLILLFFFFSFSVFAFQFFRYSKEKAFLFHLENEIQKISSENEKLEIMVSQLNLSQKIEDFAKENNFIKNNGKILYIETSEVMVKK
mgnify:CR=1 FL=1